MHIDTTDRAFMEGALDAKIKDPTQIAKVSAPAETTLLNPMLDERTAVLKIRDLLTEAYGDSWVRLNEPETLWAMIARDWKIPHFAKPSVAQITKNKIGALKTLYKTDDFWTEWHVFEKACQAFNDALPYFDAIQTPSPAEMAYTMYVANEVRKDTYTDEVLNYIAAAAYDAGLIYLSPPYLSLAQEKLNRRLPDTSLVASLAQYYQKHEGERLETKSLEETLLDIQLAKLLAIKEYLLEKRGET